MPAAIGPVQRTPTQPPARHLTPTHRPTSPTTNDYPGRLMACHQQTTVCPKKHHSTHSNTTAKTTQPIHTSPGPAQNPHT